MQGCRQLKELVFPPLLVLLRVDFNLPLHEGKILDETRLEASLPTIASLLERGARLLLLSHLGAPNGYDPQLSLQPIADRLGQRIGESVGWLPDLETASQQIAKEKKTRLFLLENLRFFPGERSAGEREERLLFLEKMARLGGSYVNDAFATAHRKDASCVGLPSYFKGKSACGLLMEKEISFLQHRFETPERPFVAILGGAKISSKLHLLDKLLEKCDQIIVVGAMAYTFLVAKGFSVGASLYEKEQIAQASTILKKADLLKKPLFLGVDAQITDNLQNPSFLHLIPTDRDFPLDSIGVDIGPKTIQRIAEILKEAKMIFWNGPAGVSEYPRFAKGTEKLATLISQSPAVTIVGGGDSTAAITQMGLQKAFTHVSTGGGASLELIEKGDLPALQALREAF